MTGFPIGTLILPEPQRGEAWRSWRKALDIDALSYEGLQLLPAVADSLPRWLEGDPAAARFQGIVKMVWSRNQVRLHKAAELQQSLTAAAVETVVAIGPLAWSLRTREEGSIRSIPSLTLLISRQHLSHAVSALARDGWVLSGDLPVGEALDWSCFLPLTKGDETLHLHWRVFPAPADQALPLERAFLERRGPVSWNRQGFPVLSAEADLLHRLTDRPSWDPVPWQADVLMTPFAVVDWQRFRELANRFAPAFESVDVLERLMELRRDWQLPVPEMNLRRAHPPAGNMARALLNKFGLSQLHRRLSARRRLLWKS